MLIGFSIVSAAYFLLIIRDEHSEWLDTRTGSRVRQALFKSEHILSNTKGEFKGYIDGFLQNKTHVRARRVLGCCGPVDRPLTKQNIMFSVPVCFFVRPPALFCYFINEKT